MKSVFLCYSRNDLKIAEQIVESLEDSNIGVWFDLKDIPAGGDWDKEVNKALFNCKILVVIISNSSIDSEEVLNEISVALDDKKEIVPIKIDNSRLPLRISRKQYINLIEDFDYGITRLKLSVNEKLGNLKNKEIVNVGTNKEKESTNKVKTNVEKTDKPSPEVKIETGSSVENNKKDESTNIPYKGIIESIGGFLFLAFIILFFRTEIRVFLNGFGEKRNFSRDALFEGLKVQNSYYKKGLINYNKKNYDSAKIYFWKYKENPSSANMLGYMYYNGIEGKKNIDSATYYYKKSANHGNKEAMYNLGLINLDLNLKGRAKIWFEKSLIENDNKELVKNSKFELAKLFVQDWFKDVETENSYPHNVTKKYYTEQFIDFRTEFYQSEYSNYINDNEAKLISRKKLNEKWRRLYDIEKAPTDVIIDNFEYGKLKIYKIDLNSYSDSLITINLTISDNKNGKTSSYYYRKLFLISNKGSFLIDNILEL